MQFLLSRPTLAHFQPEDDIDKLFNRLSQLEPSGELISRILSHVRHVSAPFPSQSRTEMPGSEGLDSLVVRNEKRDPS